jgi:phenylalanyl-tRNA synthetase beta chain
MRIPYEWLKEFIDISASSEEIADRLTMTGFEVEGVEFIDDDVIFEVNVTPNRPDCLSVLGIARELSVTFNVTLKIPLHEIKEYQPVSDFSIEILKPEICNRYTGRLITEVKISDSPDWIKIRLEKCGIRPINNVVDITNYVLFEFGHPLHAFDADTINGKKIKVDIAGSNNKIVTLDGVERELYDGALLIWDDIRPIAVAGVMGGLNTEVTEKTRNVFLESAYFDPFSIRKTSKWLNLKSESSYRFERGTDIEFLENALNRAALLIKEFAEGTIHEIIDAYPVKYRPKPIEIRYEKINKLLGTNISKSHMLEILKGLGIHTEDRGEVFVVYPPTYRRDIKRNNDIAEEIARLYGYEYIPVTIPRSPLPSGQLNKKAINIKRIKEAMRKAGFTEAINYSFMSMSSLDMLDIPDSDKRRKVIILSNPLSKEECMLRTTLAPSLIGNLKYNIDRGMKEIRLFEVSSVFEDIGNMLPSEDLRLGGIFYKDRFPSLWKEDAQEFFITKGTLESLFEELKISDYKFLPSSEPFLHKGKASDIYVSDLYTGYIGILGPEIVERLDLKKQKPEIVLFEINIEVLLKFIPYSIQYSPIPKYPYVERDIAIVIDETIPSLKIKEMIMSYPSELIKEVSIFDYYKGGNVPEGKKSLGFNIIYRSKEKTLTDEEVEEIHNSLMNYIIEKTGGELRK